MTTRTFIATIAALIAIVVAALALGLHLGWSTLRHAPDLSAHRPGDEYDRYSLWSTDCYPEDVWLSMYERSVA